MRPTQRVETALQIIDKSRGGVEANDRFRGGDEVGERVDVVEERLSGGVFEVFDAAHVEARGAGHGQRGGGDARRRLKALDAALARRTGVGGTEIERCRLDAQTVEDLASEHLASFHDAVARRVVHLQENDIVGAEIDFRDALLEVARRVAAQHAAARASAIGF